jgi:hypothetical protein
MKKLALVVISAFLLLMMPQASAPQIPSFELPRPIQTKPLLVNFVMMI